MTSLKASFIIPFFNNGTTLPETIASIMSQTYRNYDIWIINDGSTDEESLAVLNKYIGQKGVMMLNQPNAGPSIARNLAIRQTKADIIIPLDADDKIRPTALETAVKIYAQYPDIDVLYSDSQLFGASSIVRAPGECDIKRMLAYNPIPLCTFIRRDFFEVCGYFDEYLSKLGLEDWELWVRAMGQNRRFHYHDEIMFDIRVDTNSRTYTEANKNLDLLNKYVFAKHIDIVVPAYRELFFENEWRKKQIEHRIKEFLARPYRYLKKLFKS